MKRTELITVLAYVSGIERFELTESIVTAWFDQIGHLDATDVERAVRDHYRTEPRKLWPADVIKGAVPEDVQRDRLRNPWKYA